MYEFRFCISHDLGVSVRIVYICDFSFSIHGSRYWIDVNCNMDRSLRITLLISICWKKIYSNCNGCTCFIILYALFLFLLFFTCHTHKPLLWASQVVTPFIYWINGTDSVCHNYSSGIYMHIHISKFICQAFLGKCLPRWEFVLFWGIFSIRSDTRSTWNSIVED